MPYDEPTHQADWWVPPTLVAGITSGTTVRAVTSTAAADDITDLAKQQTFITIFNDGTAALYVSWATTSNLADDLDNTATGRGVTTCIGIPAGAMMSFKLSDIPAHRFMGYKTAAGVTTTMRYWLSGPPRRGV